MVGRLPKIFQVCTSSPIWFFRGGGVVCPFNLSGGRRSLKNLASHPIWSLLLQQPLAQSTFMLTTFHYHYTVKPVISTHSIKHPNLCYYIYTLLYYITLYLYSSRQPKSHIQSNSAKCVAGYDRFNCTWLLVPTGPTSETFGVWKYRPYSTQYGEWAYFFRLPPSSHFSFSDCIIICVKVLIARGVTPYPVFPLLLSCLYKCCFFIMSFYCSFQYISILMIIFNIFPS